MKKLSILLAAIGIVASAKIVPAQDHGHLNVGATGTNQNDQLIFDNGGIFAASYNYVKTLIHTNAGRYAGHFHGNITLTALAATAARGGPVSNAPALGSFIHAQFISVDGPPGGVFAFWESGATNPTISLASGETGTNTWKLSENNGVAGTDPYGHIHGRRFTATKPGIYTVTLRALDFSTNGAGGNAIHTPSGLLPVYFQTGVQVKSVEPDDDHTHVTFGARAGYNWQLEYTGSPGSTNWTPVGTPFAGADLFVEVQDNEAPTTNRFYRAKGVTP